MKDRILKVTVDIYVKVPGDTSNVAVEGAISEGVDHGVHFMLGDYTSYHEHITWAAVKLDEGGVPKSILDTWEEFDDLLLEPKKP